MTNENRDIQNVSKLGQVAERMKESKSPEAQRNTPELPAKGEDFHIEMPNEPALDDDESLGDWLKRAHQASEMLNETIGRVLKQKRDLLASQGKTSKGGWQQWVEDNCRFSVRTANRYIKAFTTPKDQQLSGQGDQNGEKPIQARVHFSDKELGGFYKKAKEVKKVKRRLNEKFEQAAREVRDELQKEAEVNSVSLDEHLENKSNEKDEKDVTPNSSQN